MMAIFSVFSVVSSFFASHRKTKNPNRENDEEPPSTPSFMVDKKKKISKLNSKIGSKAHSMMKMISLKKIRGEELDENDERDEAVWRRTIMMGERCRPLEFSGKILYDSEGNLLPEDSESPRNEKEKEDPTLELSKEQHPHVGFTFISSSVVDPSTISDLTQEELPVVDGIQKKTPSPKEMAKHTLGTSTGNVANGVAFAKAPSDLDVAGTSGYPFALTKEESASLGGRSSIANLMSVHDPPSLGEV